MGKCRRAVAEVARANLNWELALEINWELVVRWSQSVSAGSPARAAQSGAGRSMPLSGFSIHHAEECGNLTRWDPSVVCLLFGNLSVASLNMEAGNDTKRSEPAHSDALTH